MIGVTAWVRGTTALIPVIIIVSIKIYSTATTPLVPSSILSPQTVDSPGVLIAIRIHKGNNKYFQIFKKISHLWYLAVTEHKVLHYIHADSRGNPFASMDLALKENLFFSFSRSSTYSNSWYFSILK
jgi:hypothetical protein